MKTQLRRSQPTSARRQHQPLESAAEPSYRSERRVLTRRLCRDPLRCDKRLGQHSHLEQAPHAPLGSTVDPGTPAAGLQETTDQKRARPGQVNMATPSDERVRAWLQRQQSPGRSAEQVLSDSHTVRTEDRDRKILNRLPRREAKGGEESSASGMSSTTPDGRRRVGSERQPVADRAPMQQTPDPFASQFDEAFRELLEKLVRWEISTPEDVKFMKDELAKMTNTPAPVSALPAEVEGKEPSELDAVSNEIRSGASRAEGGGESSTSGVSSTRPDDGRHDDSCPGLGPESTATTPRKAFGVRHGGRLYAHLSSLSGPSPPEMLRNLHDEVPQETPNSVRRSDAGKPEGAEEEGRDEAREEAESLAFDVVDRLDGGDPADDYVFNEVEGCLGNVEEDGAGMCHVSYKEFPGAVDDEYVLL